jgi:hypothetical protein
MMMSIEEILAELSTFRPGVFPREAIQAAIEQQAAITPALLGIAEQVADDPQWFDDNTDEMGFIYALFLLAQFREKRAYPLFVRYFEQLGIEDDAIDATEGVVTEDLGSILASVCHGEIDLIKQLIENPEINEYVRTAGLDALVILYNHEQLTREELITYFQTLLDNKFESEGSYVLDYLVHCCSTIYPGELYDKLIDLFDQELIDEFVVNIEELNEAMKIGKDQVLADLKGDRHHQLINNTIENMEWWACFQPNEQVLTRSRVLAPNALDFLKSLPNEPYIHDEPYIREIKVGRNDPCPCGSGKKYKKCCLH